MTMTASQWDTVLDPALNIDWWDKCYVPSPADVPLRGISRSVIVVGVPGSGKSVAINTFERQEKKRLFIFRYPLDCWYGEPNAWVDTANHLSQIMACASMAVKRFLVHHPEKLGNLKPLNLEYLRWLIEKHSNQRAFLRWADALNYEPLISLGQEPFDDIYPTVTDLHDVQGQIEELVTLSRRLDFKGVAVLIDLSEADLANPAIPDKMVELFSWLTPLQFDGFALKAAVPESAFEKADLMTKPRDRVSFAFLRWRLDDCYQLVNKYLAVATNDQVQTLTDVATDELIARLANELQNLYGFYTPKIWFQLVHILIKKTKGEEKLTLNQLDDILHTYYANYVPLKFDKTKQGVWRGKEFIKLDPQPLGFFEELWGYQSPDYDNYVALENWAGSRGNLNTITSRLRHKIEPIPKQPVYIKIDRGRCYWLENVEEFE